jgi:hypothetical protein
VALVFSSLLVSQKSIPSNKNSDVYFGYPIGFVKQDFSDYDPEMYYQSFSLKRDSAKTEFLLGKFIVSLLAVSCLIEILIYAMEFMIYMFWQLISERFFEKNNLTEAGFEKKENKKSGRIACSFLFLCFFWIYGILEIWKRLMKRKLKNLLKNTG